MEKDDRVTNVKTNEFGTLLSSKKITTASGQNHTVYEVVLDSGKVVAWKEDEIALWEKPASASENSGSVGHADSDWDPFDPNRP